MIRRVSLVLIVVATLAGCSTVPGNTGSTQSASGSPSASPAPTAAAGGGATDFCSAFKELQDASAAKDMATVGAAFQAAATDMRTFAPPAIASAAGTYADVIDNIGKAVQANTVDQAAIAAALADGMKGKAADIGTVAKWVATNCTF